MADDTEVKAFVLDIRRPVVAHGKIGRQFMTLAAWT
jgi:hypothetical protein